MVRSADLVKKQLDFLFSDSIGIEKRPKFEDKKNKRRRF